MRVVRINRMILGVASPVAAFIERVFGVGVNDVDSPEQTAGADVLVVGRQQIREDGTYRLAHDVIPRCLDVHPPSVLIAVLPDRFDRSRYARDLQAWKDAATRGPAVVVFELGALRERDEASAVADARRGIEQARQRRAPVLWFSHEAL